MIKVFFVTFCTIFLAELFDKTEFAVILLAAKQKNKFMVLLGSLAAFFVATVLAVFFGSILERLVNPKLVRYISAAVFFITGFLILFNKI